jgi:hypothetical protein
MKTEQEQSAEEIISKTHYWCAMDDGVYYRKDAVLDAMEEYTSLKTKSLQDQLEAKEKEIEKLIIDNIDINQENQNLKNDLRDFCLVINESPLASTEWFQKMRIKYYKG